MVRRSFTALMMGLLLTPAAAYAQTPAGITQYPLPPDVTYPEGIAYDAGQGAIYTGSAATGAVVRMTLASKETTVVSPAGALLPAEPFPALLGMKIDAAGRLWVAGGRTGRMAVIDSRSGKLLKKFETAAPASSLINDVALAGGSAYFTDSLTPTLWRVNAKGDQIGELEPWLEFAGSPLQYTTPGANLNGITATPDGRHLIVVQMNKGLLFRITVQDKRLDPIDVGGAALTAADGLVLDGRTLHVVRQGEQEIVTIELAQDLGSGRVVSRFKNPALMWPATAVKVGDRLLVVNTQFNKRTSKDPVQPFSIVSVPLSMLSGK
jgi:sugar lactone lactonase YvrE